MLVVAILAQGSSAYAGTLTTSIQRYPLERPAQPAVVAQLTASDAWMPMQFNNVVGRPVSQSRLRQPIPKGVRLKDLVELSRSFRREIAVYRSPGAKGRAGLQLIVGDALSVTVPEGGKLVLHTHPLIGSMVHRRSYIEPSSQDILIMQRHGQRTSWVLPLSVDDPSQDHGYIQKVHLRLE